MIITKNHIEAMLVGSSVYSTGGGIEYSVQNKLFKALLSKYPLLELVSIDELKNTDAICTAYCVGSAANTNVDVSKQLKIGMKTLEKLTKRQHKAIFAGETNIDIIAFQAATSMGLPVLDGDSNGGRAVPEIQFDNYVLKNKSMLPVIVVTPTNTIHVLAKTKNVYEIETFVRSIVKEYPKQLVAVLDHSILVKDAKKILTLDIFERSIKLGKLIVNKKSHSGFLKQFLSALDGKLLITGKITHVQKNNLSKDAFLEGFYFVEDKEGRRIKIYYKNENLIAWENEKPIAIPPDSLYTIDQNTLRGIHNSKLRVGKQVLVVSKQATKLWQTKKAKKLFSVQHFGFDS